MSGHSKWHSIKHKKGAVDAARGKVFTRHAKLVEIAAREGGNGDPDQNAKLRTAIADAKVENVPNANIDRAIKKGTGELKGAAQTVSVIYEAYGPKGSAFIIECLTDNKNRTLANVKTTLGKNGGRFAESGSVMWMFEQKGVVVARQSSDVQSEEKLAEDLELSLIDAGAEDIDIQDSIVEVITGREGWGSVRDLLKEKGYELQTAGLKYVPKQTVEISGESEAKSVMQLAELLEEDDDVSEVHTNAEVVAS